MHEYIYKKKKMCIKTGEKRQEREEKGSRGMKVVLTRNKSVPNPRKEKKPTERSDKEGKGIVGFRVPSLNNKIKTSTL